MGNPTILNTSKPGNASEHLPIAVQGSRDTITVYWLYSSGAAVDIDGATLTGVYKSVTADAVYSIDGVLTVTDGANGIFTWAYGAADVGAAGSYLVQIKAVLADTTIIYASQVGWAVEENLTADTVAAGTLVGVSVAEAAWLTAAEGSGVAGADIVGESDTQTLTNKTIDYDLNTITNLPAAGLHASDHTDGTDDIQNATAAQKGVATAAQITKLDAIEAAADVTDATNVAAAGALMTTGGTMSGDIAMADGNINRAVLKDYGEEGELDATSTATKTLDIAAEGNGFDITLTDNCTFTFSNPSASGTWCSFTLILRQDGTGNRTVVWPGSVDWASATAPTLSTGAADVDVFTFLTVDAGTIWLGFTAGLDLS